MLFNGFVSAKKCPHNIIVGAFLVNNPFANY